MRILSRSFWWTKKSDEEYVELVRRQIRFENKGAIFGVIASLLAFASAVVFGYLLLNAFTEFDKGHRFMFWEVTPGIALGIFVGLFAGFFCFIGIVELCLAMSFMKGFRTERLLLKFYDQAAAKKLDENKT